MQDFEAMAETIRVQLTRGTYLMDDDDRPYSGAARVLTSVMYGQGYRKVNNPRVALETALAAENNVWVALTGTMVELQEEHDRIKCAMEHDDDYQRGALHGLDKAIINVRQRIELCDANIAAHTIQLQHVIERDKLNP